MRRRTKQDWGAPTANVGIMQANVGIMQTEVRWLPLSDRYGLYRLRSAEPDGLVTFQRIAGFAEEADALEFGSRRVDSGPPDELDVVLVVRDGATGRVLKEFRSWHARRTHHLVVREDGRSVWEMNVG